MGSSTENQDPEEAKRVFEPLVYAPMGTKKRYSALARRAKTSYRDASKLFCVECVGWSPEEAKKCTANHCPLWSVNRGVAKH